MYLYSNLEFILDCTNWESDYSGLRQEITVTLSMLIDMVVDGFNHLHFVLIVHVGTEHGQHPELH